jgi:fructose-bisphosphate aldolase class II
LIGVSEGERDFLRIENVAALVRAARSFRGAKVFLNADHTHSVEGCKAAIDAGFDSVMFDGSKLSMEENIEKTREVVAYAKESGHDVLVEGELGYIGTSSALLDSIPEGVENSMTTPTDATRFVRESGVDLLAPSVGNVHGMLKHSTNPRLDIARIQAIADAVDVPLVLHGGSGITDNDFTDAIAAGVHIVHINTEIRVAYRKGIEAALQADHDQVAPYKYLGQGKDALSEVVRGRMRLFSGIS